MRALGLMLPEILELSERYGKQARKPENNPFDPALWANLHPKKSRPPKAQTMAMDNALIANNNFASQAWLDGGLFGGLADAGLMFLGYPYLAELAQRTEYRNVAETIADDATRRWIDFDVTGDENDKKRQAKNDPKGAAERDADPDERKKRVAAAGKTDKVKELKDDQERLAVRDNFYGVSRDDSFFGRSHLYLNFGTDITNSAELAISVGNGRDTVSKGKKMSVA